MSAHVELDHLTRLMPNSLQTKDVLVSAFLFLIGMPVWAALIVDGYTPATNDRFTNDPAFIAGNKLGGVGRSIDYSEGRWATLISPNVFLSANHFKPDSGDSITFFATNDPLGDTEQRTILSGKRIGDSDLWIGILDEMLPKAYQPLPILDVPILDSTGFESSILAGREVFMIGRNSDTQSLLANLAAGKNRIDQWIPGGTFTGIAPDTIGAVEDLSGDPGYLPFEALVQQYDSGAPLLADVDGNLTLVGINWYLVQNYDLDPHPVKTRIRNLSGFSYVGNYAPEIQGIITAFAIDATSGYLAWMAGAFGGEADWARTGPAVDFDQDGLVNLLEYAFAQDPLSGAEATAGIPSIVDVGGNRHLAIAFKVREDSDLQYAVRTGSALSGGTRVSLVFNGLEWSSVDPETITVAAASALGDGVWALSVRVTVPLDSGTAAFISLIAE